jgi:hypothetical protein
MGGTIATITPDQILAFFGYPEAHEDDAERAVNAGLDAVAKVSRLPSVTGEPLQIRVGVATVLALASQVQTVGGPSVVTVGVCDLAAPNSVLVTASTRALLSSTFVCNNPERYAIAGLSEAVSACHVTGKRAVASRFRSRHSNKITGLVGRDQELQQLVALWDRAKRGEGQVGPVAYADGDHPVQPVVFCRARLEQSAETEVVARRIDPLAANETTPPWGTMGKGGPQTVAFRTSSISDCKAVPWTPIPTRLPRSCANMVIGSASL